MTITLSLPADVGRREAERARNLVQVKPVTLDEQRCAGMCAHALSCLTINIRTAVRILLNMRLNSKNGLATERSSPQRVMVGNL